MNNISTNINLSKLKSTVKAMSSKTGEKIDCIVIPIEMNNLVLGDKGVYMNLTHIPLKNPRPDSKDTHLVKQNLPKDVYQAMTEDQRMNLPIIGNSVVWGNQDPPIERSDDLPEDVVPF